MTDLNKQIAEKLGRDDKSLMGPPERGPWIRIVAEGLNMNIQVNDEMDKEIVDITMRVAEKKRYGCHFKRVKNNAVSGWEEL